MKAKKWLEQTEKEFEIRNIKEDNPTTEELRDWWKKSGQPLKKLFNTSGILSPSTIAFYFGITFPFSAYTPPVKE